jgi:hypothetical protein
MEHRIVDQRTLRALQGSIRKWQAIVDGTGTDEGCTNCPLCEEFAGECDPDATNEDGDCHGCPVKAATGRSQCEDSPYYDFRRVMKQAGKSVRTDRATSEREIAAAQAELRFLESLLPPRAAHGQG